MNGAASRWVGSSGRLRRALPFLKWFPMSRRALLADLVAGAVISFLLIPQSMAYAQLAGLPPYYGLYAAFLPTIFGALFGSCAQLATGPVAMTSLICMSVLSDPRLGPMDGAHFAQMAVALAFMAGVIRIALGLLKWSPIINFIPYPVILGFTNAGALIIACSQLGKFLGVPMPNTGVFLFDVLLVISNIGRCQPLTLFFGVLPLALIFLFNKINRRLPTLLIALVLSIAVSRVIHYADSFHGQVLGTIPKGFPHPGIPALSWLSFINLLPGALVVVMVGLMEATSVSKIISSKTRKSFDLDQELIGQGMANLAGSFSHAYPTSGSFSRSALNYYAGAVTGLSSVFAGFMVLVTLLFLTPFLYHLPQATLAAIVVLAVSGLINFKSMFALSSVNKHDSLSAWMTFAATLVMAPRIVEGILLGTLLTLGYALYRISNPHVAVLGQDEDGNLRDAEKHRLTVDDDVLILRYEGRLIFANAAFFEETLVKALAERSGIRAILVNAAGINEVDVSGVEKLHWIADKCRKKDVVLAFAELKWKPTEVLRKSGLMDKIGEENFFRKTADGYDALKKLLLLPKIGSSRGTISS